LRAFLERLTSRSVLSDVEQRKILALPAEPAHVGAARDFVRLGEVVDHASLIVEGLVARFDQTSAGNRQITALHIPGDVANLQSVAQPSSTSALQALCPVTLLRIPHDCLRALAAESPAIAEAFWRDGIVDSSVLAQWIVNIGQRSARARIAHLLCEMGYRYGAASPGKVIFRLPMTQEHMAEATGITPVHVNRTLMSLRHDGVLIRHRTVYIDDWATLTEVADFDATYLQAECEPRARLRLMPLH